MGRKHKDTLHQRHHPKNSPEQLPQNTHVFHAQTRASIHTVLSAQGQHVAAEILLASKDALVALPTGSYDKKLEQFLTDIAAGASLTDAAVSAGFTTRETMLPPEERAVAKARIVLESFLKHALDRKHAHTLLIAWNEAFPVRVNVLSNPQWLTNAEHSSNYAGKVRGMCVERGCGMSTCLSDETGLPTVCVPQKWHDQQFHNTALEHIAESVMRGEADISDFRNGSIRLEKRFQDGRAIVCVHTQTDSRVWGEYDNKTGIITWKGIVPDHRRWVEFLRRQE